MDEEEHLLAATAEQDTNVVNVEDDSLSEEEEDECRVCRGPAEEG